MKKEEIIKILDKHLKTLIKGKEDEWFKFEEMKTMPEYAVVLNAMLEVVEKIVNENYNKQTVNTEILPKCDRVEVIDQSGRAYVNWKPTNKVQLMMQDNDRTLKVFIS